MPYCPNGHALFEGQHVCPVCAQKKHQEDMKRLNKKVNKEKEDEGRGICLFFVPLFIIVITLFLKAMF